VGDALNERVRRYAKEATEIIFSTEQQPQIQSAVPARVNKITEIPFNSCSRTGFKDLGATIFLRPLSAVLAWSVSAIRPSAIPPIKEILALCLPITQN